MPILMVYRKDEVKLIVTILNDGERYKNRLRYDIAGRQAFIY